MLCWSEVRQRLDGWPGGGRRMSGMTLTDSWEAKAILGARIATAKK